MIFSFDWAACPGGSEGSGTRTRDLSVDNRVLWPAELYLRVLNCSTVYRSSLRYENQKTMETVFRLSGRVSLARHRLGVQTVRKRMGRGSRPEVCSSAVRAVGESYSSDEPSVTSTSMLTVSK